MKDMIAHYNPFSQALHWGMALVIVGMLASGLLMEDLQPLALKFQVIQMHKSFGLLVLWLVIVRLLWRFTTPAPMLPAGTPLWQKLVAHGTHALLYVLMVGLPLSGWLMSDAKGYHPNFFGLNVPVLMAEPNKELGHLLGEMHEIGAFVMMGLLALHIGAAVMHRIKKDGIAERMLPARRAKDKDDGCCGCGCKH